MTSYILQIRRSKNESVESCDDNSWFKALGFSLVELLRKLTQLALSDLDVSRNSLSHYITFWIGSSSHTTESAQCAGLLLVVHVVMDYDWPVLNRYVSRGVRQTIIRYFRALLYLFNVHTLLLAGAGCLAVYACDRWQVSSGLFQSHGGWL